MMPLGEEVGMVMGQKLGRTGILALAFVLGILVTMAEPAIATLQEAGKLVHADPDCENDHRAKSCTLYDDLLCKKDQCSNQLMCDADCVKEAWKPGAPYLYATVNLWAAYRLPITIGTGVGMACTVGMLRSLLDLKMKRIIFILGECRALPHCSVCLLLYMTKPVR